MGKHQLKKLAKVYAAFIVTKADVEVFEELDQDEQNQLKSELNKLAATIHWKKCNSITECFLVIKHDNINLYKG